MSQIKSLVTWFVIIALIIVAFIVLTKKGTVEINPLPIPASYMPNPIPADNSPWKE